MKLPFLRGVALVAVSAAGFGLMPIFAEYAYRADLNVSTLLLLRFSLAAAALLGYLALRRRLAGLSRRELGQLALLGAVLYALQSLLYFSSVQHISPALAVLLLYLYPAFVLLLSATVDRQRPTLSGLAAIALSLGGMALVVGIPAGRMDLTGVAYAVGAGVVYAVYIVVGNRLTSQVPPLTASGLISLFAAGSFAVTGLVTGSLDFDFEPAAWAPVLGVTVASTVVAIGCFFAGLALIGPTRSAIVSMVEPVVSIVAAWLLLGATMTGGQLAGGAVVLAGAIWGVTAPARTVPTRTVPARTVPTRRADPPDERRGG